MSKETYIESLIHPYFQTDFQGLGLVESGANNVSTTKNLIDGIIEMHQAFGYKIAPAPKLPNAVRMLTPEGIPIGTFAYMYDFLVGEGYFHFIAPNLIHKARKSARCNKSARESAKISTLIRALKANYEVASLEKVIKPHYRGVFYGVDTVRNGANTPKISLAPDIQLELVRSFFGEENNLTTHASSINVSYNEYKANLEKYRGINRDHERFCRGFYATLIFTPVSDEPSFYISAEYEPSGLLGAETQFNPKEKHTVTRDISDLPHIAPVAMMCRTFLEGPDGSKYGYERDNAFGVRCMDRYIPELDISCGYVQSDGVWVLVPKFAE